MPRRLLLASVALMLLPAVALVWLGWRLLEQDRLLEREQRRERSQRAAEAYAAQLHKALSAEHLRVATAWSSQPQTPQDGALLIAMRRDGRMQSFSPSSLLYQPAPPGLPAPRQEWFREAEVLEFQKADPSGALRLYESLARSQDRTASAGARVRMARVYRSSGRIEDALRQYEALSRIDDVGVAGVPVSLLALRTRCLILEESGRREALRRESLQLLEGLRSARWRLDQPAYLHYRNLAATWAGEQPAAPDAAEELSAAVARLWKWWRQQEGSGLMLDESGNAILWRVSREGLAALIAPPSWQRQHWFTNPQNPAAWIDAGGGRQAGYLLPPSQSGLPWTIAALDGPDGGFAARRRMMAAGLTALLLLLVSGAWIASRAIHKELSVARLQSDFVAAVSHEFRTPLTTLQQFNEMLAEDATLSPADRSLFLAAQGRATRRLRRLVESLLDFGRMESGRRAYRFQQVNAASVAAAVTAEFQQEQAAKEFSVSTRLSDVPVWADPDALGLALWNLLDNAVKYSGTAREIAVTTERNGTRAYLRVSDNGPGVALKDRKRIFQKFVRGSNALLDSIPGTGLGLAMVDHIARVHHGAVSVESRPGAGSTFTIELPLRENRNGENSDRRG